MEWLMYDFLELMTGKLNLVIFTCICVWNLLFIQPLFTDPKSLKCSLYSMNQKDGDKNCHCSIDFILYFKNLWILLYSFFFTVVENTKWVMYWCSFFQNNIFKNHHVFYFSIRFFFEYHWLKFYLLKWSKFYNLIFHEIQ